MRVLCPLVAIVILTLAVVARGEGVDDSLYAQTNDAQTSVDAEKTNPLDRLPRNTITVFAAGSFANAHLLGKTSDRRLAWAGVRYSRLFAHNRLFLFSFTPEIIPVAVLSQPVFGDFALIKNFPPLTRRQVVYGAGANPMAVELSVFPGRKIQPYIGTAEGFLYFSRNVPFPLAAQFNFTVVVSTGMKVRLSAGRGLAFAYAYHHLSNASAARQNPGIDSHVVSIGYTFALHRHN